MATARSNVAPLEKRGVLIRFRDFIDNHFEAISVFPTLFIVLLVVLVPTILVIWQSFYKKDIILRITKFIGIGNYIRAFSGADVDFYRYLGHTMIYVVFATIIGLSLCILLAVLLNSRIKYRGLFVAGFLLPWMVPPVTAAIMWKWMLNDSYGVLNYLLVVTGFLYQMFPFFSYDVSAWIWLIWVDIWYNSPFFIIIIFAGAILSFLFSWNEFLFALTLTRKNAMTVPIGIVRYFDEYIDWGLIAGSTVIAIIPAIIFILFFQRYIVSGITAGAVKN